MTRRRGDFARGNTTGRKEPRPNQRAIYKRHEDREPRRSLFEIDLERGQSLGSSAPVPIFFRHVRLPTGSGGLAVSLAAHA